MQIHGSVCDNYFPKILLWISRTTKKVLWFLTLTRDCLSTESKKFLLSETWFLPPNRRKMIEKGIKTQKTSYFWQNIIPTSGSCCCFGTVYHLLHQCISQFVIWCTDIIMKLWSLRDDIWLHSTVYNYSMNTTSWQHLLTKHAYVVVALNCCIQSINAKPRSSCCMGFLT